MDLAYPPKKRNHVQTSQNKQLKYRFIMSQSQTLSRSVPKVVIPSKLVLKAGTQANLFLGSQCTYPRGNKSKNMINNMGIVYAPIYPKSFEISSRYPPDMLCTPLPPKITQVCGLYSNAECIQNHPPNTLTKWTFVDQMLRGLNLLLTSNTWSIYGAVTPEKVFLG